jgi:amino acid transporter
LFQRPKRAGLGTGACYGLGVFSARLERLRQVDRLAVLAAATLLTVGIALIAVWAVRALNMLEAAEVDRAPIIIGVLIALAVLVVLCLVVYAAVRAVGRFMSL